MQAILLLIILGFAEALLNAAFFHNAHMVASPSDALLTSLLISVTNITVSACGGFFIKRWMSYGAHALDAGCLEFRIIRIRAQLLFLILIGVITFLHITVGLVRAQESLEIVYHSLASYKLLVTTPEALFLVLTGTCLSVLACHKGSTSFGGYPGHDERHRAVEHRQNDLRDEQEFFKNQISDRFDEAIDADKQVTKQQDKATKAYNRVINECCRETCSLKKAVKEAESQMRMQTAQMKGQYHAIQGDDHKTVPDEVLEQLASFDGYLDFELPRPYHPPETNDRIQRLQAAKSDALKHLNELFQNIIQSKGETL